MFPSVIFVTEQDIRAGAAFKDSDGYCPIGLAVERAMLALGHPVTGVLVTQTQVKVWGSAEGWVAASLPTEAAFFVTDFDTDCTVDPLCFEVARWR